MEEQGEKGWQGWQPGDQYSFEIANPIPNKYIDLTKMLFEEHPYTPMRYRNIPTSGTVLAGIFGGIVFLILLLRFINVLKDLIT
jgi:hypothetical protein